MQELILKNFEYKEGEYIIPLYRSTRCIVTSKKAVTAKLYELSRDLTGHFQRINDNYQLTLGSTQMLIFFLEKKELKYYNDRKADIDEQIAYILHSYEGDKNEFYFETVVNVGLLINKIVDHIITYCASRIAHTGIKPSLINIKENNNYIIFQVKNTHIASKAKLDYLQKRLDEENT